jgi:hypothetical protein
MRTTQHAVAAAVAATAAAAAIAVPYTNMMVKAV